MGHVRKLSRTVPVDDSLLTFVFFFMASMLARLRDTVQIILLGFVLVKIA